MKWDYRIGTKSVKNIWYGMEGEQGKDPYIRLYMIIKCLYFNEGEPPHTWSKIASEENDIQSLAFDVRKMGLAFQMPIIDIDNFPNEIDKL